MRYRSLGANPRVKIRKGARCDWLKVAAELAERVEVAVIKKKLELCKPFWQLQLSYLILQCWTNLQLLRFFD